MGPEQDVRMVGKAPQQVQINGDLLSMLLDDCLQHAEKRNARRAVSLRPVLVQAVRGELPVHTGVSQ